MVYLLYGPDFKKSREKYRSLLDSLAQKKPEASVFKLTDEDFSEEASGLATLEELVAGLGLFGGSYIVSLEGMFSLEENTKEKILSLVPEMAEIGHVFVFLDSKILAKEKKVFEDSSAKIQEFKLTSKEDKKPFNSFALSDALGERNKKKLWTLYQEALRENVEPELVAGTLFWQIKTLLLMGEGGGEADMKPFVISKARRNLPKWDRSELIKTSSALIGAYHSSRTSDAEMEIELEKFILSL